MWAAGAKNSPQAAEAVREELGRLAGESLSAEEIAAGKGQLKGQITLSLESVTTRMYRAAGVDLYGEPYRSLDEILALVDAVTEADVAAVCREFFDPAAHTVLSLGPRAAA